MRIFTREIIGIGLILVACGSSTLCRAEETMDVTKMTTTEIKAMLYDDSVLQTLVQEQMKILIQELQRRAQPIPQPTVPPKKEKRGT